MLKIHVWKRIALVYCKSYGFVYGATKLKVQKWGMLCSYRCWTASWQMCELFSPNCAAWRSQEPKHHTLSSAPRWWNHANPSEKNMALGNDLEKLHLQRRILPESFKNHGPRIWQFDLFTTYITWISICISCQPHCAIFLYLRNFVLIFLSSQLAFHHKDYISNIFITC